MISLDFTIADECKPKINEFEYLTLAKIYAHYVLPYTIYTVVLCKLHSNSLSHLEQIM